MSVADRRRRENPRVYRQHRRHRPEYPREFYDGCGTSIREDEDYSRIVNDTAVRRYGRF